MKAVYLDFSIEELSGDSFELTGDKFHHLVNVMRVKNGEKVLLISNTPGFAKESSIVEINKRVMILSIGNEVTREQAFKIDLAFAVPKRDALEDLIKSSVEVGINKLIPLKTDYSWSKYSYSDRISKLITSAVEQSNNLFRPEFIEEATSINDLDLSSYESVIYFSSNPEFIDNEISISGKTLIIIGAEGGMSPQEELELSKMAQTKYISIPIMRAKTAAPFLVGSIIGKLSL